MVWETSLERMIVVSRGRFSSGHLTVGGEKKNMKTTIIMEVTDFMICRKIEVMAENRWADLRCIDSNNNFKILKHTNILHMP